MTQLTQDILERKNDRIDALRRSLDSAVADYLTFQEAEINYALRRKRDAVSAILELNEIGCFELTPSQRDNLLCFLHPETYANEADYQDLLQTQASVLPALF